MKYKLIIPICWLFLLPILMYGNNDAFIVGINTDIITNPAVLPSSPSGCNYTNVTTVNLNASGGNAGTGETTEYVLTNISGTILQIQATPTFNGLTTTVYAAYALSYEVAAGVTGLTIGQNIQNASSTGCLDFSLPHSFRICPQQQVDPEICNNGIDDDNDGFTDCDDTDCNCVTPVAGTPAILPPFIEPGCDYESGQTITLSTNGGSNAPDETISYILTDEIGDILQTNNSNATFSNLSAGTYIIYVLAYKTNSPPNNLTIGQNVMNVTSTGCLDFSQPYAFIVCEAITPGNCDYNLNTLISLTTSNSNTVNAITKYFITDATGLIITTSTSPAFLGVQEAGMFFAYALSYENTATLSGDSVGDNINSLTVIGTTCYDWSPPLVFDACNATEDCTNAVDDDGDMLVDCSDPDCQVGAPGLIIFD